jgi:hypothetical protein
MNWYFVFYLFSLADKISSVSGALAIITAFCLALTLFIGLIGTNPHDGFKTEGWKIWRKFLFTFIITGSFFSSVYMFTPDREDMLLIIAGGSVGEFVASDENVKQIPSDITRFLRKEILEATADMNDPEAIKEALGLEAEIDTLKDMSKEELIKLIKNQ